MARLVPTGGSPGTLAWSTTSTKATLSRSVARGDAVRLAPGIYLIACEVRVEDAVGAHLHEIVGHLWPGTVLCGRSALSGGRPLDGTLFVARGTGRRNPLILPGCTIVPVDAPSKLPADLDLPFGIAVSGVARSLVENVHPRGRRAAHRAGMEAVEARMLQLALSGNPGTIARVLDDLDAIAPAFPPSSCDTVRRRLAALLGTDPAGAPATTDALRDHFAGIPADVGRLELLDGLAEVLQRRAPRPILALGDRDRLGWLPFFEAYFSNFIEGTEFAVDAARRIAVDGEVPADRPEDAHDVAATFALASNPADTVVTPRSSEELIELLVARHAVLMGGRAAVRPGAFKRRPNFAGGYEFVRPELVLGTLTRGFDRIAACNDAFARAVMSMALITECHPFDDGNGRLARLMANAELSAAGEVRLVVPTIYRGDYLAALAGFSRRVGRGEALVAVLEYAQRWTASVDWGTYEAAIADLTRTNAFLDPRVADASRLRLELPR